MRHIIPRLLHFPHRLFPPPHLSTQRIIQFSTSASRFTKPSSPLPPLPPRPIIRDADITESFLKGTGPGGQKINKTNSAVQIKHLASGIVVKCQISRSRSRNRNEARKILQEKIESWEIDCAKQRVLQDRTVKDEDNAKGEDQGKDEKRVKDVNEEEKSDVKRIDDKKRDEMLVKLGMGRVERKRAAERKKKERAKRKRQAKYRSLETERHDNIEESESVKPDDSDEKETKDEGP